jgi:hypothetical protein
MSGDGNVAAPGQLAGAPDTSRPTPTRIVHDALRDAMALVRPGLGGAAEAGARPRVGFVWILVGVSVPTLPG